ncbi:MAG: hypothetical protein V1722_03280 [Candidatus Micrarchaeota archaeon]
MSEERGKTGREFVIVSRKELVVPEPVRGKSLAKDEPPELEDPSFFDSSTEAFEVGGYHFIRPQEDYHRRSQPTFSLGKHEKGFISANNGVVAISTNHGTFVGYPGPGFHSAASRAGFVRGAYNESVPHSNYTDSPWLFERIDLRTGRLKPEYLHLFNRRYKPPKPRAKEAAPEVEEPKSPVQLLISDIKDDHVAFRTLHNLIDDEMAYAFTATEIHKPNPAVIAYAVRKLGLSRASAPEKMRKDVKELLQRFHPDKFKPRGFDQEAHRKVVDLLNSVRGFLRKASD